MFLNVEFKSWFLEFYGSFGFVTYRMKWSKEEKVAFTLCFCSILASAVFTLEHINMIKQSKESSLFILYITKA